MGTPASSGILSYPCMRAISSTKSISRTKSRRQLGGTTVTVAASACVSLQPKSDSIRRTSSAGTSMPSTRGSCESRSTIGSRSGVSGPTSITPSASWPPANSRINSQHRRLAQSTPSGSTRRSKRYEDGLCSTSLRAVVRIDNEAKSAASISTSTVSSDTSVSAPPITPPRATARLASAITHMPGSNS